MKTIEKTVRESTPNVSIPELQRISEIPGDIVASHWTGVCGPNAYFASFFFATYPFPRCFFLTLATHRD